MKKIFLGMILILTSCSHFEKTLWILSKNPNPKDSHSIQRGKVIYQKNCASCHGQKALGDGPNGIGLKKKPTNLIKVTKKRWDSTFAAHVAYGKFSNPDMPRFEGSLSQKDIWDVTNYVYSLK